MAIRANAGRCLCLCSRLPTKLRVICILMLVYSALVFILGMRVTDHVSFEVQWQRSRDDSVQLNQSRAKNALTTKATTTYTTVPTRRTRTTARAFVEPAKYRLVLHSDDLDKAGVPGMRRDKQDGAWYRSNSAVELYVYSAHYDDRASLLSKPVVRVIGVSELKEEDQFYCVVWFQNKTKIVRIFATMRPIGDGVFRHEKYFQEFVVTCPMFDTTSIPTHVSVVLTLHEKPTFATPVEVPERFRKQQEIGICVSLSYWHHDPNRIVEWIEFQRSMGVGGITIYNNSLSEESQRVFSYYSNTEPDFLLVRQSFVFLPDNGELTFHMQMSPVINDCLYRYRLRYKSILVIDLDEFVVPHSTDNFLTMISAIKQKYSLTSDTSLTHQFTFRNTYFFFDFAPMYIQPPEMVTMRYMRRADHSPMGYSAKSLVGVNSCIGMHNHYCWHDTAEVQRFDWYNIIEVKPTIACLHHYKKCHLSREECQELFQQETLDQRMLHFETTLKQAVSAKRVELGMGPLP